MSYDLVVWFEPAGITLDRAVRRFGEIIEGETEVEIDQAHPRVAAFLRELTGRYPDPDGLAIEEIDRSPWSQSLSVMSAAVFLPIVWSRADEVDAVVRNLANQHGLVLYDPQNDRVQHPDGMRTAAGLVLMTCDGSQAEDPDPDTIERILGGLSRKNWFAIIERNDDSESYVQVAYNEGQGADDPDWFALERRAGSADEHFRVELSDLNDVVAAFNGFARDETTWTHGFEWQRIDLAADSR